MFPLFLAQAVAGGAGVLGQFRNFANFDPSRHGRHADPLEVFDESFFVLLGVIVLVNFFLAAWMQGGITGFALKITRGHRAQLGDVFKGAPYMGAILLANLLVAVGVLLGSALLIVPGIIFGLGCSFVHLFIVDRGLGAVEAVKASWELSRGHRANIFLMHLMIAGIAILGACACGVGALIVGPIQQVATVYVYLRLHGERTAFG